MALSKSQLTFIVSIFLIEAFEVFFFYLTMTQRTHAITTIIIIAILYGTFFATFSWYIQHFISKRVVGYDKYKKEATFSVKWTALLFVLLYIPVFVIGGFYNVETKTAIVKTDLFGVKSIVDADKKLHWRMVGFESLEEYDLKKTYIEYPIPQIAYGDTIEITTKDDYVLEIRAIMEYQIDDLDMWAVSSKDTQQKLYNHFGAVVAQNIKNAVREDVIASIPIEWDIMAEIMPLQDEYGFKIIGIKLINPVDVSDVISEKSKATVTKIAGDTMILSAEAQANATKIISQSEKSRADQLQSMSAESLDYLAKMRLYDEINTGKIDTIVVPNSMSYMPIIQK